MGQDHCQESNLRVCKKGFNYDYLITLFNYIVLYAGSPKNVP